MKQVKRATGLILAAVMICSMALMGCQSKLKPADQVIGALYDLAAKDDAVPMKDLLGFANEDDVRSSILEDGYEATLINQFSQELSAYGIDATDEDIQEMADNMMVMLDKLTYTAEITEQTKDKTVVKLNVQGYTQSALEQVAMDTQAAALEALTEEEQAAFQQQDMEFLSGFMIQFMKDYTANAGELEPTETSEIIVNCEQLRLDVSGKEQVEWLPSDMAKFGTDVENSIFK